MKSAPQQVYISAPLSGRFIPQELIPDSVFSQGILGPGCGIEPVEQVLCAPLDGTIGMTAATHHSLQLISREGVQLLMHVGIDTVEMLGQGFTLLTEVGQEIRRGDPLLSFDLHMIRQEQHPTVISIILENPEEFIIMDTHQNGFVAKGETILGLTHIYDVARG